MPCIVSVGGYALIATLLFAWARWLRRRTHAPRWASWLAYAFVGLVVLAPVWLVIAVFGAISGESVDPSGRARIINLDVDLSLIAQALVLVPLTLTPTWLLLATWRWHWAARGAVVPRDPPYR